MRVTFEFDSFEDSEELEIFEAAPDMHIALGEFRQWLRNKRKYVDLGPEVSEFLEQVWDAFHDYTSELHVEL